MFVDYYTAAALWNILRGQRSRLRDRLRLLEAMAVISTLRGVSVYGVEGSSYGVIEKKSLIVEPDQRRMELGEARQRVYTICLSSDGRERKLVGGRGEGIDAETGLVGKKDD